MNLGNQLVSDSEKLEEALSREIDYNEIDRIRNTERERAILYLRTECGEENGT